MRELLYTILELEEWNKEVECSFCPNLNKAVCQIRTRSKATEKIIANDEACESCKEKFENDELLKCKNCGRLQIETYIDIHSGKHVCRCIRRKESVEEKELPALPIERRQTAFYERQINSLQEKLTTAEETIEVEREVHEDFMKTSEVWSKRQKQELLDKIAKLEQENNSYKEEVEQLKEQNKKLVPKELANKIELYEKEIAELKIQLEQLTSQQTAQIEVKEVKKWP
jgi:hypothetical protein